MLLSGNGTADTPPKTNFCMEHAAMNRRIVITGLGILSPLGVSTDAFWENCLAGKTVVEPIPPHWRDYYDYSCPIWSPLPPIDYESFGLTRIDMMQLDKVQALGICAARQALEDAGLNPTLKDRRKNTYSIAISDSTRFGVHVGTGIGGIGTYTTCEGTHLLSGIARDLGELRTSLSEEGADASTAKLDRMLAAVRYSRRFNPFAVARCMPNACSAAIGIKFSAHGPNTTPCCACASGTVAVGRAFREIQSGTIDISLCGGSECIGDQYGGVFRGFDVAKTLLKENGDPSTANRPFDHDRTGFLLSEGGSGILVLEELEHARRRGARMYAEVRSFAETFDAFTVMGMDPEGTQIERLGRRLLTDASLTPADVDYINAHGTGTETNDNAESSVIERLFGAKPIIAATKSLSGHAIGASGAIEAIVTALSLYHQTTHACRNLDNPIRDLNFAREARPSTIRNALTHSFAFGGHNAGLVLSKAD
ncbi:MAG: hypothetical protein GF344_12080 [Chitinivibrionales bacterium]|nr:hypothetical protein [Chitinivibrionales bacterium]MBD3357516.1 hypothetical protein [Chitinivibrionales bacterium]